jgi:hypothetical protein
MKKTLLTTAQIAVTVALLYYVFRDPAKRAQMGAALAVANYWWILAAIGTYFIVCVAAAYRWQVLLRVQGIRLANLRVGALFMIGMFYNQFMPGGTGGDIIKTYLLFKETPDRKAGALLAVLFDRIIGPRRVDQHHRRVDRAALQLHHTTAGDAAAAFTSCSSCLGSAVFRSRHDVRDQRLQPSRPAPAATPGREN